MIKLNSKHYLDYDELDTGIRNVVQAFNQIKYVSTISSCEGHIRDYIRYDKIKPKKNHVFFHSGGHLMFFVDKIYRESRHLLNDLGNLRSRYHFVDLIEHSHCSEGDYCNIKGSFNLILGYEDLNHRIKFKKGDDIETIIRKRHEVRLDLAKNRMTEFKQVWDEVLKIAQKYILC